MRELKECLDYFEYVSKNPKKLLDKYINEEKKVIGCMPYYNVQPIISALGMVPMSIWGANINSKFAGRYSPSFTCSLSRSCLELGMNGTLDKLSAVVMPILCDTLRGQVTAWRAGVKGIRLIPFVPPQNRKDSGALDYYIEEIKYVAKELEIISGVKLDNRKLEESLKLYNERNLLVRKFIDKANKHLDIINAQIRHYIMKAITFMSIEEGLNKLRELNDLLDEQEVYSPEGKRIFISGIILDKVDMLKIIDDSNMYIVGDDLANESRLYRYDYPMSYSAFESFVRHWMLIKGCSLIHDDDAYARGKMLVDVAKKSCADIVILAMMKFCDIEEYDQPYIVKMLQDEGFVVVSIDVDQSSESHGQVVTKLQALSDL